MNNRAGGAARASLILVGVLSAGTVASAAAEDCIFDQAAQRAHYREMERRIAGARFDAAAGVLTIARGAAVITIRRGGCVHFGLRLTHTAPAAPGDTEREAVFARAVALVAEFGGDELVTAEEVDVALRLGDFALVGARLYYLHLPGVEVFSIGWGVEDGRLTVEVAYYI